MNQTSRPRFELPVAIHRVTVDRSSRWLAAGWRDLVRAPGVSLTYGLAFVAVSYALSFGLVHVGLGSLVLPLAGGFMLVAPLLVVGLYDVSRRLERGDPVSFFLACRSCRDCAGRIGAMGVVLMLFLFAWVLIALALFALIFNQTPPSLETFFEDLVFSSEGALLLIVGTVLGAGLASGIFAISAVSIPMLLDREVDVVTAIVVSISTVTANGPVMFGWAAMIGVISFFGLATFYLGLAVALPLLAYATWHAYRDLIGPLA